MDITVTQQGNVTVVALAGAMDVSEAEKASGVLNAQLRDGRTRLVADATQLEFVSSTGLRVFVQTLKEANRRGGDFRLAGARPNLHKVLEITGLTSLFKFYPDVNAAVASFA